MCPASDVPQHWRRALIEMRGVDPDHSGGLEGRFIILVFPLPIS